MCWVKIQLWTKPKLLICTWMKSKVNGKLLLWNCAIGLISKFCGFLKNCQLWYMDFSLKNILISCRWMCEVYFVLCIVHSLLSKCSVKWSFNWTLKYLFRSKKNKAEKRSGNQTGKKRKGSGGDRFKDKKKKGGGSLKVGKKKNRGKRKGKG